MRNKWAGEPKLNRSRLKKPEGNTVLKEPAFEILQDPEDTWSNVTAIKFHACAVNQTIVMAAASRQMEGERKGEMITLLPMCMLEEKQLLLLASEDNDNYVQ